MGAPYVQTLDESRSLVRNLERRLDTPVAANGMEESSQMPGYDHPCSSTSYPVDHERVGLHLRLLVVEELDVRLARTVVTVSNSDPWTGPVP